MTVAQSNRHSKTSAEVVNEKKGCTDFNSAYWMLGRDWNEAPEEEIRSQQSGVRSQE
jgi:hypothetical protein